MRILGIETSCDETSAAIVDDGASIISNVIASQIDIHGKFGGVVPEIASRRHVELILPTIQEALEKADCTINDLDCVAAINRPGLIGALIVGAAAAKTIAYGANLPLVAVHHLEAHIYANFLTAGHPDLTTRQPALTTSDPDLTTRESALITSDPDLTTRELALTTRQPDLATSDPDLTTRESALTTSHSDLTTRHPELDSGATPEIVFPLVCLIVSGGHSDLVLMDGHGKYRILARTRDDAAGEAFDKCARAMGLGYPGGPLIDKLAREGDPNAIAFPRAKVGDTLDFSFSGLKTAVIRYAQTHGEQVRLADIAASFQQAVVDVLVDHTFRAVEMTGVGQVLLAGGVAANSGLQAAIKARGAELGIAVNAPPPVLCTDNAAMAAAAAFYVYQRGECAGLDMDCYASEPLGKR